MNSDNGNKKKPTVGIKILGLALENIPLETVIKFLTVAGKFLTDLRFVIGLIFGIVLAVFMINQLSLLSVLPPSPLPPMITVKEPGTNTPKFPEPVKYLMSPGEIIQIEISSTESEAFNWSLLPPDFGQFIGNNTGREVIFEAPGGVGKSGVVQVCDPDPTTACRTGGWVRILNISVTK